MYILFVIILFFCFPVDFDWVGDLTSSVEDNLHRSVYSYRKALELAEGAGLPVDRVNVLLKRYGNVENELGVFYMNKAGTMLSMAGKTSSMSSQCGLFVFVEYSCLAIRAGIETVYNYSVASAVLFMPFCLYGSPCLFSSIWDSFPCSSN